MIDEKTDALTDMAYYHGARHAMSALSAGMDPRDLSDEMEARVGRARKWLAEERIFKRLREPDAVPLNGDDHE